MKKIKLDHEIEILEASIKDDFCNYKFQIVSGVGAGDEHAVKGKGIVDGDMHEAFAKLNAHLASIDDVFKHKGVNVTNIDTMHTDELTQLYHVTGFKLKGTDENKTVVLIGTKHVSEAGGRMDIETPKIPLDSLSSYKWYNELKDAVKDAVNEVKLYRGGKYTEPEPEAEPENKAQLTIGDGIDAAAHDEFEAAKK